MLIVVCINNYKLSQIVMKKFHKNNFCLYNYLCEVCIELFSLCRKTEKGWNHLNEVYIYAFLKSNNSQTYVKFCI